jgi:hypothetical protein
VEDGASLSGLKLAVQQKLGVPLEDMLLSKNPQLVGAAAPCRLGAAAGWLLGAASMDCFIQRMQTWMNLCLYVGPGGGGAQRAPSRNCNGCRCATISAFSD